MPLGPGKYDPLCTYVRVKAKATGVAIIVMGGEHGNGFAVQAPLPLQITLPELLEGMAREIRAALQKQGLR